MAEPNLYEQDELEREYPNFASCAPLSPLPPSKLISFFIFVRGSFGTVYKGRVVGKRAIAKRVVIKDQMADDEKKLAEFTREVDIMLYALPLTISFSSSLKPSLAKREVPTLQRYSVGRSNQWAMASMLPLSWSSLSLAIFSVRMSL